jgi:probable phosphoglycerate mutase
VLSNLVSVPSAPSSALPITLVRHGETEWNALQIIQGQDDTARLNEKGREQARVAGASLRDEGFEHVVASDLARAQETAAIIASILKLDVSLDPLLRERSFGVFEKGPISALASDATGILDHVLVNPDARPAGGESFRDMVVRADLFFDRVANEWSRTRLLVVTHGGTIRALRASAAKTNLEGMVWDRVGNCSVWTIDPLSER